jgi:hypothetical protein
MEWEELLACAPTQGAEMGCCPYVHDAVATPGMPIRALKLELG